MTSKFRNSTALAIATTLMVGPAVAQETPAACLAEMPEFPCVVDDQVIESQEMFDAVMADTAEAAGQVVEDEANEPEGEAAAEVSEASDTATDEIQETLEEGEAAQEAISDRADQELSEALDEVEAEAETAADAEAEAEAEAEPEMAPEADAEADVAPEAEAQVDPEAEPEAEAAADPAAEETTQEGAVAEATVKEPIEESAGTEATAAETTEESAEAEAAEDATPESDTAAEGEMNAEADSDAPEETAQTTDMADAPAEGDTAEPATTDQADAASEDVLPDDTPPAPEDTVEETSVAAAAAADADAAEVEEETVAEGDVRSSDQDFETSVNDTVAARDDDDDDNGDLARALVLGLGALAIGSQLSNGDEVVTNSGDRVIVQQPDGTFRVLKDDDVLLRQPGSNVRTERFDDGSTRTTVTQADGREVVTIRNAEGRVLRRALILEDGSQVLLLDDLEQTEQAVDVASLPAPQQTSPSVSMTASEEDLRAALAANLSADLGRTFSLRQVRTIREVRELAPLVELDTITFETGSAAIRPEQAQELAQLGTAIRDILDERPGEVFLIEGHTDAVGNAGYNLGLSDRRAETVALALTEYFDVPPANLVTQGYGESILKVRTLAAEEENRRASVRNITDLLR